MAALKKGHIPFESTSLCSFWMLFHHLLMPRRIQITSKTILQEQKPNDPLNKFRLLWRRCKRLMPKGGQFCLSGLSQSSSSSATQRAQGWLRLAMTSVVDFKQIWKHFHSTCTQTGIRATSPRQQNYSLELAWSIQSECFLPMTLNLQKNTGSSESYST